MHAMFNEDEMVKTGWLKELVTNQRITEAKACAIQRILNKNYYSRNKIDLRNAGILSERELDKLDGFLTYLMSDNGIRALVCGYCDVKELIEIILANKHFKAEHLKHLFSDHGLMALANGWISIQQAAKMPYPIHLKKLFSDNSNGIIALQFGYITPEQVAKLDANFEEFWRLDSLLSPKGLTLLMHNKIEFEESFNFKNNGQLENEINERITHLKSNVHYLQNN